MPRRVPLLESLESRCLFSVTAAADAALPVVTVTARRAAAYEGGPRTRIFVLRRTGDVTNKLVVHYTVGGKAKAGLDYNDLGSAAAFKAGYAIRNIAMTAIDDSVIENNESITLTLNATAAYTVSAAAP